MNNYNNDLEVIKALVNKRISSKEEFIGLLTIAIYSKEIFVKNEDAGKFVKEIFDLNFLEYVVRSRTLLCARLSRRLVKMDKKEMKKCVSLVAHYFSTNQYIHFWDPDDIFSYKSKRSDANKDVNTWIKALLRKDKK